MAPGRAGSWVILVLGILLALVSVFADPLGVGGEPGFGWKQQTGLAVGLALTALAAWQLRRSKSGG